MIVRTLKLIISLSLQSVILFVKQKLKTVVKLCTGKLDPQLPLESYFVPLSDCRDDLYQCILGCNEKVYY